MTDMLHDLSDRIVVGFDGSEFAGRAVRWAAREAVARSLRLTVLYVADADAFALGGPDGMAHWWPEQARRRGAGVAADGIELARKAAPDVDAEARVEIGPPAAVLVAASRAAALLALGTRGRNPLAELCLGSVAETVAAHGHGPVVVVRRGDTPQVGPEHPVVVGVDGSTDCRAAVEYAAAVADRGGAALLIACIWDALGGDLELPAFAGVAAPRPADLAVWARTDAQTVADAAAETVHTQYPHLQVRTLVPRGMPAEALIAAAQNADSGLLVAGTRGRGAFRALVLGSVSHAVVRAAPCAVAVVPSPGRGGHRGQQEHGVDHQASATR